MDRGTIVGTYENRRMGFYSSQLYDAAAWKNNNPTEKTGSDKPQRNIANLVIIDQGTDLRDSDYSEIWRDLQEWAAEGKETELLSELESQSKIFSHKEKPFRDCLFQIGGDSEQYKCDLFWKKSRVALFTSDNEDCYLAAKGCDIQCYFCADNAVTVDGIFKSLKER